MVDINYIKAEIIKLYPDYCKVGGPYERKDKRKHLILYSQGKPNSPIKRRTLSWPKAIMEVTLGKKLSKEETVDHKDDDFSNNSIINMQILKRKIHIFLDVKRMKSIQCNCIWCDKLFFISSDQIKIKNKAGPFCSKSCSGKYGVFIQKGGKKISRTPIIKEYYKIKNIPQVSELVQETDLKSVGESLAGSNPALGTIPIGREGSTPSPPTK